MSVHQNIHQPATRRNAPQSLIHSAALVYSWCMGRTNVDIDDKACAEVMRRYQLRTKPEAINFRPPDPGWGIIVDN